MIKLEEESNSSNSLPEEVLGKISQVASIKIPKLSKEGKKRNKKEHRVEKMEVGSGWKNKVVNAFNLNEFWVAENKSNISEPLPEKVSGISSQVASSHASIKIPKFIQEVKKRKKK